MWIRLVVVFLLARVMSSDKVYTLDRSYNYVGKYGDIESLHPTGASAATARSDGLTVVGVKASYKMAENDDQAMSKYKANIKVAAEERLFDPAVIAGIISRESRAGKALRNGWGDHGNAWGLMQIDRRFHTPIGGWHSVKHIRQGTDILISYIEEVQNEFPSWPKAHHLQGGIAAYNFGVKNVRSWRRLDDGTTHNDYSHDVVARAQYFRRIGYN